MRRWDALVDAYIRVTRVRGLSELTVHKYHRELQRFGCWLKRRKPRPSLEKVDSDLVIRYIRSRTTCHTKSMIAGVMTPLRMMGDYLVREGYWNGNPLRWMRGPKLDPRMKLPRRIGKAHLKKVWDTACSNPGESARLRLMCLLSILYGTGLRRGEIERLNISHWNREEGTLDLDGRKTNRERRIPVGEGVWRCVEAYLPHRHNLLAKLGRIEEGAFFVNKYGRRLKGQCITRAIRRVTRRAGVPFISMHRFRHSCASDLLESGVSLSEVQKILGHAVITTTMRYTHVSGPQRAEAIAKHPINEFLSEVLVAERKVS